MGLNKFLGSGFSFGLTSGIITTLGLIVGLNSSIHSRPVIIGAILTIAIADAFSDALGIHIAEESKNIHSAGEIWSATISTFLSKFVFAVTFIVPVAMLPLEQAIWASLVWGLSLLGLFSYYMAKNSGDHPFKVVAEHLLIAIVVIILTHSAGVWIGAIFC